MATIWIDGARHDVDPQKNLLQVCQELGLDLPYFCWHPALGSVGACRQCAVKQFKDENDQDGRIVMACMTPASDGTRISIVDPEAAAFRQAVIEWLMVNHPHDCPVCDEGGECHLQDMTVMTGHAERRYRYRKRTFRNQDLGPFVRHEMNRCIQCYRCVRFYNDYAGDQDLQAFASRDHVYFGRHEDGPLESEFAGNLVEVCPTGVFTDRTLGKHYTRKWDLRTAPSVCVHCGLGCNTIPGERLGVLRRIRNRYNGQVNGYFLCDRGRYGHAFVNDERRIRQPLAPRGTTEPAAALDRHEALARAASWLGDGERVIGIGSPRASVESNFLLRALVGVERFYQGVPAAELRGVETLLDVLRRGPSRSCPLGEVGDCDAVLVLGEDAPNTAPMLALALRQAGRRQPSRAAAGRGIPAWHDVAVREVVQEERGPIFVATPADSKLDRDARRSYRGTPEAIARLGHAIAHALDANAPAARDLEDAERHWVAEVAGALRTARRPLVVSGTSAGSEALLAAAANVAWAAGVARREGPAELFLVVPEANTMGLALLGGASLDDALARIEADEVDTVIVVENDLEKRLGAARLDRARLGDCRLIVIDHLAHATAARADLVLPAATFAEGDGTLVNNEGRAQRFFQVMAPAGDVVESWRWIAALAGAAGRKPAALEHARATAAADGDDPWHAVSLDDVTAAVSASVPALARLREAAPRASFRLAGARLPRDPYRSSGRTAMHADRSVHEPRPPDDHDSPLAFSMEGYRGPSPAALVSQFWAPGWNSIQALNRFQQEIGGPLRGGDAGVRLIEPRGGPRPAYLGDVPAAAGETSPAESGTWRAVPLHHVFGSETLSAAAPAVAERSPAPYAGLGPDGAASLGVATGDLIELEIDGGWHALPVRLRTGLPAGVVGVPVEVAGLGPGCLPARLRIRRAAAEPRPAGSGRTPDDGGAGAAGARNESAGGGGAHPGGDEHA